MNRLLGVVEGRYREHRAEDFLAEDSMAFHNAVEQCRQRKEPALQVRLAREARQAVDLGALLLRNLQVALHAFALSFRRQWAKVGIVQRPAEPHLCEASA